MNGRVITAFGGLALVATLIAGCGSGPPQAGAAAVVGNTAISLNTIQQRVDAVLSKEPAARQAQQRRKLDIVSRQVLGLAVQHELIKQAAARWRLVADPSDVDTLLRMAGGAQAASRGTVLDASGVTRRYTDEALLAALARTRLPGLSVTFDYALVDGPGQAADLAHRIVADPGAEHRIMAGAAGGGHAGAIDRRVTAATDTQIAVTTPLFGLPANTVAGYPLGGASARWMVVFVHQRRSAAPGAQAAASVRAMDSRLLSRAGLHLLSRYARSVGVRVSPRYGVWDPIGMDVAASADRTRGIELAVHPTP